MLDVKIPNSIFSQLLSSQWQSNYVIAIASENGCNNQLSISIQMNANWLEPV